MPDGPDWLDREAYPFDSHYHDHPEGRVHYVDEGEGRPVVTLHGNPTWSFLYRELVRGLRDDYRAVAPDYLGFGLSEKPPGFSYRPPDHAAVVADLIDHLGLEDVTLVVHDWGGPIGLHYAAEHPENVRALVVTNTFMWPIEDAAGRAFAALLGGPLGRVLCERYNAFARYVMKLGVADRSRLPPAVHDQYLRPLATAEERTGTWVFPRELVGSRDWLADLWGRRSRVADLPALLVWGMRDVAFDRDDLRRWQALFPDARTVELGDASHYLHEEKGAETVEPIREFLAGT